MLASLLAPYITGTYDVTFIPLSLPTALVTILLPSLWSDTTSSIFLSRTELEQAGLGHVPNAGEGRSWIIVQAGQQKHTGVGFGPGRKTFYEAKLEIPFLRHPEASSSSSSSTDKPVPFTYKHTILFSSFMMAFSSQNLSGLTSHKVNFQVRPEEGIYQAEGYLSVKDETGQSTTIGTEGVGSNWSRELVEKAFQGWFVGENTGSLATRFSTTMASEPIEKSSLHLRLHLPTFTSLPLEAISKLLGSMDAAMMDENGWYDVKDGAGWQTNLATKMEVTKLAQL